MSPRSPARRASPGRSARSRASRSSAPPEIVSDEIRAKVLEVHRRLCVEYGCPIGYFHDLDPLSELISSLLSHRTKNADSGRAFKQLRRTFPSWPAVRDAPVEAVQDAIRPVTWPELKAPRIQAILRELTERLAGTPGEALGDDALDFLGALPVREARDWLESLTGVGPKTSAAVLSFSRLRLPALPVDSHHHRVAVRLGLIPASVDVGPAHAWLEAQLPSDWTAQQVYDNHEVLMLHGQHICHWRDPECARCVVLDLCPTGQQRLGVEAAPAARTPPTGAPERPLPPTPANPVVRRSRRSTVSTTAARPDDGSQEQLIMAVNPHPNAPGIAKPDASDHRPVGAGGTDGASRFAHGTHGEGDSREEMRNDEQAVDSGDREPSRLGGSGPQEAPNPDEFAKQLEGRMGGAGWGNEAAGGSTVDRRHDESTG